MYLNCFSESMKDSSVVGSKVLCESRKTKVPNRLQKLAGRSLLTIGVLFSVSVSAAQAPIEPKAGEKFSYDWLKEYARNLAVQPYQDHKAELPKDLTALDWDDYQQIRFKKDQALWGKDDSEFRTEFFHLGNGFDTPVHINELDHGKSIPVPYSAAMFDYAESKLKGKTLSKDLGFAGFKMQYSSDWQRDVVAFLGASYFRAVGDEMQYGLSARGLAVDTALQKPEEFPVFTNFWFEKPKPNSKEVVVYALMDSQSVSGAYRFHMKQGEPFTMKVDAAIYPRKSIERLGVAAMTSMYMVGENDRRTGYDWRPEVHDSDGLSMQTGSGEWIWRPLANPKKLGFNSYSDNNPKGFGLLQRDRNFDHYQDDGLFYEKRPSLWIEPIGKWGKGSVQLVEIPTLDETFDNIVAFWKPAQEIKRGQELLYSYNMYWGSHSPKHSPRAQVVNTFTGIGGVMGKKRHHYSKRFAIDFAGGSLAKLDQNTKVKAVINTSKGKIEIESARPLSAINGYRVMFDYVPEDNTETPVDMNVYLEANGKALSETWQYQWTPPAGKDRELHNPGHLR